MERIGKGKGVAALLNGRAKMVTPKVVRALQKALPQATVLVSRDIEQARRQAGLIAEEKPYLVLCGGGDGTIAQLLNLLREQRFQPFPTIGPLKLGTGNGWANSVGAGDFCKLVQQLPRLPSQLPTQTFNLIAVEGTLCHFAGLGWDGKVLNDYLRNLDKRSSQLFGSRLALRFHKGLGGYLYAISRMSIPDEWRRMWTEGTPRLTLENTGQEAFTLDAHGNVIPWGGLAGLDPNLLYEGPVSVATAGTVAEFGFRLRVFPFARAKPGFVNVRVYAGGIGDALRTLPRIWMGRYPLEGMHDFFVKSARMRFSRPMPFEIGGDGVGERDQLELSVAPETVEIVDWPTARDMARG
ncbi:MAG: diacylglycerol/lipid kinase family protein [Myxococcales bacterium]|jgi:diacylglycerol kinase family enzyme